MSSADEGQQAPNGNERVCAVCGGERSVVEHHRNADRSDNRDANLIYLCRPCHSKVHLRPDPSDPAIVELQGELPEPVTARVTGEMASVTVHTQPQLRAALDDLAEEQGTSRGEQIRRGVRGYVMAAKAGTEPLGEFPSPDVEYGGDWEDREYVTARFGERDLDEIKSMAESGPGTGDSLSARVREAMQLRVKTEQVAAAADVPDLHENWLVEAIEEYLAVREAGE